MMNTLKIGMGMSLLAFVIVMLWYGASAPPKNNTNTMSNTILKQGEPSLNDPIASGIDNQRPIKSNHTTVTRPQANVSPDKNEFSEPKTERELLGFIAGFIGRYHGYSQLYSPDIEKAYQAEGRSNEWAHPLENIISDAEKKFPAVDVISRDCHTSICRIEYIRKSPDNSDPRDFFKKIDEQARQANTPIYPQYFSSGQDRIIGYLFSLTPPAAYVYPLESSAEAYHKTDTWGSY